MTTLGVSSLPNLRRRRIDSGKSAVSGHFWHRAERCWPIPFHDLELSYRPADLRSLIQQAHAERKTVSVNNVERRARNGELVYLKIDVTRLQEGTNDIIGFCISFADITVVRNLENDMLSARHKAQTVSEELQAANEELQSTNEELETTNEEMQSAADEELQTINEELRERADELNNSNGFLNSILSSLRGGCRGCGSEYQCGDLESAGRRSLGAPIGGNEGSVFAPA